MTVEDVRDACQALAAEGVQPSGNTLVHYSHTRGARLSKRTALKHLRALADAGEVFTPVRPEPPPVPAPAPVPALRLPAAHAGHISRPWPLVWCGGAGEGGIAPPMPATAPRGGVPAP